MNCTSEYSGSRCRACMNLCLSRVTRHTPPEQPSRFARSPSKGCPIFVFQTMRDEIVRHRVRAARDFFIDSIDPAAVCRLASSYHNDDSCALFKPAKRGSFNVCFFVEFSPPIGRHVAAVSESERASGVSDGTASSEGGDCKCDRWVVRIAITPHLAFVDEKLQTEVATMRYCPSLS